MFFEANKNHKCMSDLIPWTYYGIDHENLHGIWIVESEKHPLLVIMGSLGMLMKPHNDPHKHGLTHLCTMTCLCLC